MRNLAILAAVMLAGCATHEHLTTLKLAFNDGTCSGTVVGTHTVLTATHCFDGANTLAIDGKPVQVISLTSDGNDHTLVLVSATFDHVARLGLTPSVGEIVHQWGNPGNLIDMYRSGEVYGNAVLGGKDSTLVGLNGFPGDSGSGLFNKYGLLVAVVSFAYAMDGSGTRWQAMGYYPMKFTAKQWGEIQ
jgi:hypothetical protein